MDKDVVEESKFGKMGLNMRAIGVMIWRMEEEDLFTKMEMYLKVVG